MLIFKSSKQSSRQFSYCHQQRLGSSEVQDKTLCVWGVINRGPTQVCEIWRIWSLLANMGYKRECCTSTHLLEPTHWLTLLGNRSRICCIMMLCCPCFLGVITPPHPATTTNHHIPPLLLAHSLSLWGADSLTDRDQPFSRVCLCLSHMEVSAELFPRLHYPAILCL